MTIKQQTYYIYILVFCLCGCMPELCAQTFNQHIADSIISFTRRYDAKLRSMKAADRDTELKIDDVIWDIDGYSRIDTLCNIEIAQDGGRYRITWMRDSANVTSVEFPCNAQLISGQRIYQLAEQIESDLLNSTLSMPYRHEPSENICELLDPDSIVYVMKGMNYEIPDIRRDSYYVKLGTDTLQAIYDQQMPDLSVVNLLLGAIMDSHYILNITQKIYPKKQKNYKVELNKFIAYCEHDGAIPYIGIKSADENQINAIVLFVNPFFGYNHMLNVIFPMTLFNDERTGEIEAKLTAYIPTHNVKNLYYNNNIY